MLDIVNITLQQSNFSFCVAFLKKYTSKEIIDEILIIVVCKLNCLDISFKYIYHIYKILQTIPHFFNSFVGPAIYIYSKLCRRI